MRESEIRELGFGPERLSLLTAKLQKWVDRGTIPGAVVAVGRRDKLAMLSAVGFRDREERAEMAPNTIFRVASLTKPIISLAAMVLVEEGRLRLWDPVSLYLPALAGLKVGVEHDAGKFELVHLGWCRDRPISAVSRSIGLTCRGRSRVHEFRIPSWSHPN